MARNRRNTRTIAPAPVAVPPSVPPTVGYTPTSVNNLSPANVPTEDENAETEESTEVAQPPEPEEAPLTFNQCMEDLSQSMRDFKRHRLAQNCLSDAYHRATEGDAALPVFSWLVQDPDDENKTRELIFDMSWLPPEQAAQVLATMANGCRAMFETTIQSIHESSGYVAECLKD